MIGLTFDTGALIALERGRLSMRKVYATAVLEEIPITVPAVVVAEWWRTGIHERERARVLRSLIVEPTTDYVARLAGAALTLAKGVRTIDAIVMASASQRRGEIVYTSDPRDFEILRGQVPELGRVRVERV